MNFGYKVSTLKSVTVDEFVIQCTFKAEFVHQTVTVASSIWWVWSISFSWENKKLLWKVVFRVIYLSRVSRLFFFFLFLRDQVTLNEFHSRNSLTSTFILCFGNLHFECGKIIILISIWRNNEYSFGFLWVFCGLHQKQTLANFIHSVI